MANDLYSDDEGDLGAVYFDGGPFVPDPRLDVPTWISPEYGGHGGNQTGAGGFRHEDGSGPLGGGSSNSDVRSDPPPAPKPPPLIVDPPFTSETDDDSGNTNLLIGGAVILAAILLLRK